MANKLNTIEDVKMLMKSSKSEQEWNANCNIVKNDFGGYPSWWYAEIVLSGLAQNQIETWKRSN